MFTRHRQLGWIGPLRLRHDCRRKILPGDACAAAAGRPDLMRNSVLKEERWAGVFVNSVGFRHTDLHPLIFAVDDYRTDAIMEYALMGFVLIASRSCDLLRCLLGSADRCVLFRKLRRFCSALHALINYLVPAAAPSRFDRLDHHRARCLAFRTVHQRVEVGADLVGPSRTAFVHGRIQQCTLR
jgi:hypothetical protein